LYCVPQVIGGMYSAWLGSIEQVLRTRLPIVDHHRHRALGADEELGPAPRCVC
jgi:hypothetical protein